MRTAPQRSVAFLASACGGLAHYVAHLWRPFSRMARPYYVTYRGEPLDDLLAAHVPRIRPLLDPFREETVDDVVRFVREHDIALVNLHIATTVKRYAPYFARLLSALRADGRRIVATLHDVCPYATYPVASAEVRRVYSLAHAWVVGNEAERRRLADQMGEVRGPVVIARHGPYTLLDGGRFTRASARRRLGLPPDGRVVLFFGMLRPDKGLDCLLRSLPLVRSALPDAVLALSCDTRHMPDRDRELAALHGPERTGLWVRREYAPTEEVEALFKAADIVALPYATVSQSGVLNVARAFARPVVVTDAFAEAAAVRRDGGAVVPVGDERALAAALVQLLSQPRSQRQARAESGRRAALRESSWERNAAALWTACQRAGRARRLRAAK